MQVAETRPPPASPWRHLHAGSLRDRLNEGGSLLPDVVLAWGLKWLPTSIWLSGCGESKPQVLPRRYGH